MEIKYKEGWLYLEPYSLINVLNNKYLIYNTLNNKVIYGEEKFIYEKCLELSNKENNYSIKLKESDLKNVQLINFIKNIRRDFSGDLILGSQKPKLFVNHLKNIDLTVKQSEVSKKMGYKNEMFDIIYELNIDIRSYKDKSLVLCYLYNINNNGCTDANNEIIYELSYEKIAGLVVELYKSNLTHINIYGDDIINHDKYEQLTIFFNSQIYYLSYNFYVNDFIINNSDDFIMKISKIRKKKVELRFTFNIEKNNSHIIEFIKLLLQLENYIVVFYFIVKSENQIGVYDSLISSLKIKNFRIKPYFDDNLYFFEKNIFLSEDEILNTKLNFKETLGRSYVNFYNFGKLTITPDGNIYTNLYYNAIGNLYNYSLVQLFENVANSKAWFLSRNKIEPCNNCIYNFLCPSISNYELAIGKYNLCNIKN